MKALVPLYFLGLWGLTCGYLATSSPVIGLANSQGSHRRRITRHSGTQREHAHRSPTHGQCSKAAHSCRGSRLLLGEDADSLSDDSLADTSSSVDPQRKLSIGEGASSSSAADKAAVTRGGWGKKPQQSQPNSWQSSLAARFSKPIEIQGIPVNSDIAAILVVYFVQGALGLARLATTFFLKDELHLSPADVAALTGLYTLPWTLKPLYGFLSDGVPIFGYRRKSYMALAGLLGAGGWLYMANFAENAAQAAIATVISSIGVAISDVVADSLVVEKARDADSQAVTGGLQSLCWGSSAVGGIISAYFSGALLEKITPRDVFTLTAFLPLLVTVVALFIGEKPIEKVGSAKEIIDEQVSSLWGAVKQKTVWLPALFIFLWQATPTSHSAFFYFLTNELHIGAEFLGRVRLGSSIASLVGVSIFQKYLKEVRVSKILSWTALISVPLGLTQLMLIYHLNRQFGIPDEWFTFGDDVILAVLGQIALMPILVLAARLCPPGVEGTLFALLMSIYNGGGFLGQELGAVLTKLLGVTDKNFDNLGLLVIICNLSSLLPLPFIKWVRLVEDEVEEEERLKQQKKSWWKR